ncbi:hypothetical protein F4810DRAFT_676848 [Camillea tinctor]|nr:hypothetical protein F4810DRAFT_676848 [Camillea tinctor]
MGSLFLDPKGVMAVTVWLVSYSSAFRGSIIRPRLPAIPHLRWFQCGVSLPFPRLIYLPTLGGKGESTTCEICEI